MAVPPKRRGRGTPGWLPAQPEAAAGGPMRGDPRPITEITAITG